MKGMQEKTREKIREIQQMIDNGVSMQEIKKKKFKNSPTLMQSWIEKYGQFLKMQEIIESVPVIQKKEEKQEIAFIPNQKDMQKLKSLLDNADEILKLLSKQEEEIEEINILTIPEELLKIDDIVTTSFRVSKGIKDKFDKFSDKNKQYSKTALINAAILEFMEKYK